MAQFIFAILSHTPPWVWLILAALVALGLRQARDHGVSPSRLWIQPLALGGLSLYTVVGTFGALTVPLAGWLGGVLLDLALDRLRRTATGRPDPSRA